MARPVIFDEAAALRIVNTIRKVETGDRAERPLTFDAVPPAQRKVFRIATFTGEWSINAAKTVTLKYQANTPNTVVATNLFFPFPAPATATDCSIAKDGTAWFLVDVPFETATAVFASATTNQAVVTSVATATSSITVLSNVTVSAVLNTTDCSITVSTTQATAAASFVSSLSLLTASVLVMSSTFTSSFVRFKVM
jgi:hypothetical protein